MALGDNLKKKKLIPAKGDKGKQAVKSKEEFKKTNPSITDKKIKKKFPRSKKEAKPSLKESISKKTSTKKSSKRIIQKPAKQIKADQQSETFCKQEGFSEQITNIRLPVYIAQELLKRKENLRSKYKEEVAALKDKNIQFVIMQIGGERYAIAIDNVKEVVPISEISKTPNTPSHIKGIANVRGNTYVVFDLADKFKVKGDDFPRYLLVLNSRKINACLTLSVLPSTLKVNGNDMSSDMQVIEDAIPDASYIKSIIQYDEQLIYYLDIIQLIKNEKAIVIPDSLLEKANE
ncbi:MAG: chemotaxis protein CheW [Ekhidna sp.]|nr:chemotaxis protein CheW [Ekhidna sp.]